MFQRITNLFRKENRASVINSTGPNVDLSLPGLYDLVNTGRNSVHQTGAVEFGLGIISRTFKAAEVSPAVPGLTPLVLGMMARELILQGNSVWMIDVEDGIQLIPCQDFSVDGQFRPSTWRYTVEIARPSNDAPLERNIAAAGIVHLRHDPNPGKPWEGVPPLIRAGMTAALHANITASLRDDAAAHTGYLIPMPDGVGQKTVDAAAAVVRDGKGGIQLVETTAGGMGLGPAAATRGEWEEKRFGPMPPPQNQLLLAFTGLEILGALGISPSLFAGEGAALRESYRHFYGATIEPMAALIQAELRAKLDIPNLTLSFPAIIRGDIAVKARALGGFTQAGVPLLAGLEFVGLPAVVLPTAPAPVPVVT